MLRTTVVICLILLILAASAAAVPVQLTRTPSAPLKVDTTNGRYFSYGGKTVVLIGMSGEFLPQMNWIKQGAPAVLAAENCGAQVFQGTQKKKYEACIDKLASLNLNVMRIWVGMNHSPGRGLGGNNDPFTYEQPYVWEVTDPVNAPGVKKWNMDKFDDGYNKSLYDVIKYAQDNGVIVEVTLFDPFTFGDQLNTPWRKANHAMGQTILPAGDPCASTTNAEFQDFLQQFVKSDKSTSFLGAAPNYAFPLPGQLNDRAYRIDNNCQNVKTRAYQVALARHLVNLLNGRTYPGHAKYGKRLYNFYWELANEPDGNASTWQQSLNWHYYMAWQLREYEKSLYPTSYHLISANLALQKLFEEILPKQSVKNYIDVVEAHYVKKGTVDIEPSTTAAGTTYHTNETPDEEWPVFMPNGEEPVIAPGGEEPIFVPDGEPEPVIGGEGTMGTISGVMTATTSTAELGALEMIRKYNVYGAAANASKNTKVWGFNETRITGLSETNPVTAASVRAEAWEFMFAGGAVYDNMGFKWGNLDGSLNAQVTQWTLDDLSRLYGIVGDSNFDLKNMKRTNLNGPSTTGWITNLPNYGSAPSNGAPNRYYALMTNNTDTFMYYKHNSRYSSHNIAAKYDPVITSGGYNDTIRFKNPFNCPATFTYQWIRPKSAHPETTSTGTIAQETAESVVSLAWPLAANGIKEISSGPYNYDIALRIKKTSGCSTLINPAMQTQSNSPINSATGAVATASSELDGDYPASSVIDGDRSGNNWGHGGGWSDATPGEFPDWIQVTYPRARSINEVDIFTLRDVYTDQSLITEDDTFSLYGAMDFEIRYRDLETGEWVAIPNGVAAANDKVWTRFVFDTIYTDAIRVVVYSGAGSLTGIDDHSRITEIETYGNSDVPPEEGPIFSTQ